VNDRTMLNESIISGNCPPHVDSPSGVDLRTFVSSDCGAAGFSTGTATFGVGAELPFHFHGCSEAITVLGGQAVVTVDDRAYRLAALDCIYIPAGIRHGVRNVDPHAPLIAHYAFSSARPTRTFVEPTSSRCEDRGLGDAQPGDPENLNRFSNAAVYELAKGAYFCDLFARRFGSVGICGGYGRFEKRASLPCHIHDYDESITILSGEALCLVQGSEFKLSGFDTAFIPQGKPHRFLNHADTEMAMLWVYSGDEPDRVIVDREYCSGSLVWPAEIRAGN
jgi:quercetin dioxygenase-like cupin family protein